ncbi:hypothetical protein [Portibacter marinus]|uniref:hypothetical protein n=1 Tax=Portibacter marinus TaxID=2898660 RepID=UPI001F44B567|nr:hypothetical protein [Portibacter marinus]
MRKNVVLDNGYHDVYSISIIVGFLVLSLLKLGAMIRSGTTLTLEGMALLLTIVFLAGIVYFISQIKLKVKIGKKKVSINIIPFGFSKIKFRKERIRKVDFFKFDEVTKSSGALIHFGNRERIFNFGGNSGMTITLDSGRKFTFISKDIHYKKEEILELIQ